MVVVVTTDPAEGGWGWDRQPVSPLISWLGGSRANPSRTWQRAKGATSLLPKSGVKFIVFLQIGPKMTFAPKIYAAVDQILQK